MIALLAAAAVAAAFLAFWQLLGERGADVRSTQWARTLARRWPSDGRLGLWPDAADRIVRAGLEGKVSPGAVGLGRVLGAGLGAVTAAFAAGAAPGRLDLLVWAGLPAGGALAPDAILERAARHRHRRVVEALPDLLDLLSVSAATGRSAGTTFAEVAASVPGPLAEELGVTVAEISCGVPQERSLSSLRRRVPGPELAALVATLERSRRYGSPLADQLRRQASALRRDGRRAVEERAARAAPKIQLVVALVLVPSVLLMIVAALVANAEVLLRGF